MAFSRLKYSGSTPGADTDTYTLWTSETAGGGNLAAMSGARYFVLDLKNSGAGTLKVYKGSARPSAGAVTFSQIEQISVAAAPTAESNKFEFNIEPYSDWKIEWVNGGSAQSTWLVDMALSDKSAATQGLPQPSTFASVGAATTGTAKAAAGVLFAITATNRNAAVRYLQLFDSTASTATVLYQWPITAAAAGVAGYVDIGTEFFTAMGWAFSTGITWGVSTTAGSYVAATASETDVAGSFL